MCNLYAMTKNREAVRQFARAMHDQTGNQPPLPAIYPDQMAPVARIDRSGERVIEAMCWGFPSPPTSREKVTTNARRLESPWWRPWLKPEFRCLVPATSFCEYLDGSKVPTWFALGPDRPLFAFAGIWLSGDSRERHQGRTSGPFGPDRQRSAGTPRVRPRNHRTERTGKARARQGHACDPDRRRL